MDVASVMRELEISGTEANRRAFRRHGMPEPIFGVSFALLGAMQRRIRRDHDLALALWATGNSDARNLATMIADPSRLGGDELDAWAADARWYGQADQLAGLAVRSPALGELRGRWLRSPHEWTARAGWCIVAHDALHSDGQPDAAFEGYVATIEKSIRSAPNRVRDAMLQALIAIGTRSDALADRCLAAARRIGPVAVDHGESGGRTPDALAEIAMGRDHRRRREGRAGPKVAFPWNAPATPRPGGRPRRPR
jgi:3-methyladenine DNA glycosylase AlkD